MRVRACVRKRVFVQVASLRHLHFKVAVDEAVPLQAAQMVVRPLHMHRVELVRQVQRVADLCGWNESHLRARARLRVLAGVCAGVCLCAPACACAQPACVYVHTVDVWLTHHIKHNAACACKSHVHVLGRAAFHVWIRPAKQKPGNMR